MNYAPKIWKENQMTANADNLTHSFRPRKEAFPKPDTLVPRLGIVTMNQNYDNISDASVLIIGFDNQEASALVSMVRAAGVNSLETCGSVTKINNRTSASSAFTHIFVNFDAFDDVDSAVTALLMARMLRRGIIFVLVSKAVARDDLSSERMFICDVTLRSPVSSERMCAGLLAARVNNEIFTSTLSGPPEVIELQK